MVIARKHLLTALSLAAVAVLVSAAAGLPSYRESDTLSIQKALDALHDGRYADAEAQSLDLTERPDRPNRRAWLIVARARRAGSRHDEAIEAYQEYLSGCSSQEMRDYILRQIGECRAAADPAPRPLPADRRLSSRQLRDLARVDEQVHLHSTEHFQVRARNEKLARLVADEAEAALGRIGGLVLAGRGYPHIVEIHVWKDLAEFRAHAVEAPEWAGGSFSLLVRNGVTTRRLDLTQLDERGVFQTVMLDRVLPHELSHLLLKERFGDARCPLFLNEGLAMTMEIAPSPDRVLLAGKALMGKGKIPLHRMLSMQRHDLDRAAVFYAQSYSLVRFLRERMSGEQFRSFMDHLRDGCSVQDALQRALVAPHDEDFLLRLASAWEDHAIADAQFLQAISLATD